MKYILQIFSGFWSTLRCRAEDVISRIDSLASGIEIDKVIIGWSTDASLYRQLGSWLHGKGIQMLLWLPIFSEVRAELQPDPAQDIFGKAVAAPSTQEGETFHFVCPSSGRNAEIVKETYEQFFSGCGFDGVFLDRIRSQSFEAGISGIFSCACERCRRAFQEKGVNTADIRKLYEAQKDAFFDVASWPMDGEFLLENPLAQRYFEVREEIVADAVSDIAGYFKSKGLLVGMDLFAPVVSRLVGQRYPLITRYADFIKPMLYRRTEAPAGIDYEYALFEKSVPGARGKVRPPMDLAFLHTQLDVIRNIPCAKYPGVEINYDEKLVWTDPGYIRESLAAIREYGFEGATLCWDIMNAPEAHTDAVKAVSRI